MYLADLSFRANHRLVETACDCPPGGENAHGFGAISELTASDRKGAFEDTEDGEEDTEDDVLSTASDADLILPDKPDSSGLLNKMMVGSCVLLICVLGLKLLQEQEQGHQIYSSKGILPNYDAYSVLNVPRDASIETINQAFRRKSLEFHPDHCASARCSESFLLVQGAVAILRSPRKRRELDLSLPPTFEEMMPVFAGLFVVCVALLWPCIQRPNLPKSCCESQEEEYMERSALKRKRYLATIERKTLRAKSASAASSIQYWWSSRGHFSKDRASAIQQGALKRIKKPTQGEESRFVNIKESPPVVGFLVRMLLLSVTVHVGKLLFAKFVVVSQ